MIPNHLSLSGGVTSKTPHKNPAEFGPPSMYYRRLF